MISEESLKEKLKNELENVDSAKYLDLLKIMKEFRKPLKKRKKKENPALKKIFSLEGILSKEKISSVELQKEVGKIIRKKYEID